MARHLSKTIAYILRHNPASHGLTLNAEGWVSVEELLNALRSRSFPGLSVETIEEIVRNDEKGRYTIREGMIRANQGHSVIVALGLPSIVPPEFLFHGTAEQFVPLIRIHGLKPMSRHAVHLSASRTTAREVGSRHGVPVVLKVHAGVMHSKGFEFTRSENGVWLTDKVPAEFISFTTH